MGPVNLSTLCQGSRPLRCALHQSFNTCQFTRCATEFTPVSTNQCAATIRKCTETYAATPPPSQYPNGGRRRSLMVLLLILQLHPGGFAETCFAGSNVDPVIEYLYIKDKKGFVRLGIENGADLETAFSFNV